MTSKITYLSDLRCSSVHLQSGSEIVTDAPTDNHGKGEAFSPTDLCATSLAQCVLTTIAILGKPKGIVIDGSTCEVEKIMISNPRRIGEIVCKFQFKGNFTDDEKEFIQQTAHNCPVAKSLHPDIHQNLLFEFED